MFAETIEKEFKRAERRGEKQKALSIAKTLKSTGFDDKKVAEITGLTLAEVQAL